MKPLSHTIETLRAAIKAGAPAGSSESVAAEYAHQCTEANRRLQNIAALLEKGSDYQALQMAEDEPPLFDLVAALSFGGEKRWEEICKQFGLTVAPSLDAKTVQALDAVYARGITANHPFYKDLRSAVLSRDDGKAMRTVRLILRLNPNDENAKAEKQRLENKLFQETLDQLREALKGDDEERISRLTEELQEMAPVEKLERLDGYTQGWLIRKAFRRRNAEAELPDLIQRAATLQNEGDWRSVATTVIKVRDLLNEHEISLKDGGLKESLDAADRFSNNERQADEKRRNFDRSLKGFVSFVEEAETRLLTGSGVSFAEIAEKDEVFVRRWKELEAFQLPVPADTLNRLRTVGQDLRGKLERLQRAKKTRVMLAGMTVVAIMIGLGWVGFNAYQAHAFTNELSQYREKAACGAAEELINTIRTSHSGMLKWPYLKAKVEEVDVWTRQARSLATQADVNLTRLEDIGKGKFAQEEPSGLFQQLSDAQQQIEKLPGDLSGEMSNRLTALRTAADLHVEGMLKKRTEEVRNALAQITQSIEKELSFEQPLETVSLSAAKIEKAIQTHEKWLKPETPVLQLPADLEARLRTARKTLDSFKTAIAEFGKVRDQTLVATTLAEYSEALKAWQDIRFAEAAPVGRALSALPTEEGFLATLLAGGDLASWKAIQDDVSGPHFSPDTPLDSDLKALLNLLNDPFLNQIWENTLVDYGRRRNEKTIYSKNRLEEASIGSTSRWSGTCYEPQPPDVTTAFSLRNFQRLKTDYDGYQGQGIERMKLSKTSEMMGVIQLNRVTDENGERFLKSLLDVFDRLINDKTGTSIAKAYVMIALADMAETRRYAWGLHLSRSLQQDLKELRRIVGKTTLRSEDWLLPKMRTELEPQLAKFFQGRAQRGYLKEAQAYRDFASAFAKAGLKFAGWVDVDFALRLTNAGRSSKELWCLSKDSSIYKVNNPLADTALTGESKRIVAENALQLSPVFFIPADRPSLILRYNEAVSGNEQPEDSEQPESPFLNTP